MTEHIEPLLVTALKAQFPSARICTETPSDLADVLPCIRVTGIGGSGDRYQFDTWRVDFDTFDATRDDARTLAQDVHDWVLRELPGTTLGTAFVLSTAEFMAPAWTPYDNTNLRRFTLAAQLRLHDRSAA